MDISVLLAMVPAQYVAYVTAAVAIASALATVLPPPTAPTGLYYRVYQVVNLLAMNKGNAANANAPKPPPA